MFYSVSRVGGILINKCYILNCTFFDWLYYNIEFDIIKVFFVETNQCRLGWNLLQGCIYILKVVLTSFLIFNFCNHKGTASCQSNIGECSQKSNNLSKVWFYLLKSKNFYTTEQKRQLIINFFRSYNWDIKFILNTHYIRDATKSQFVPMSLIFLSMYSLLSKKEHNIKWFIFIIHPLVGF